METMPLEIDQELEEILAGDNPRFNEAHAEWIALNDYSHILIEVENDIFGNPLTAQI